VSEIPDLLSALILGLLQGLTEFLPVSSSGHLVLAQELLAFEGPKLVFDLLLHLGTLASVLVVFRRDIVAILRDLLQASNLSREGKLSGSGAHLGLLVVVGTVPTALIGLLFQDQVEALFSSATTAALALLVTGAVVFSTRFTRDASLGLANMTIWHALAIGVAQGMAIVPGISRSGITIACALALGLERELSARFSFLLAIPAIVGGVVLKLPAFSQIPREALVAYGLGTLAAFVSGLLCLILLLEVVRRKDLSPFAWYCWALGLVALSVILVS
jgi:undecaprenyl-diphosphatase